MQAMVSRRACQTPGRVAPSIRGRRSDPWRPTFAQGTTMAACSTT
jgi:hypothetical protein